MKPLFRKARGSGFTLTEVLAAIAVLVVLAILCFPVFRTISSRMKVAGCVANERQLAVALGSYIGDHRGAWPHPDEYRPTADPPATWLSRVLVHEGELAGMGKLFPYFRDKRIYVCPADANRMKSVQKVGDFSSEKGSFPCSYVTRGYGQSYFPKRPYLMNTATMGRRAIYSCQFAYAPSNPKSFPLSYHSGKYPVLFSDGSVEVLSFPKGSVNEANPPNINDSTARQIRIWDYFDGSTANLSM